MVPAEKILRLTIEQLWGPIAQARGGGGARFFGDLETVIGLAQRRKNFGAGFKNKNYPLPPIWPIALKRHFSVKKSTFREKFAKSVNIR